MSECYKFIISAYIQRFNHIILSHICLYINNFTCFIDNTEYMRPNQLASCQIYFLI